MARAVVTMEPASIQFEDETQIKNKARRRELESISSKLLKRAIFIMQHATQEQCERLERRIVAWRVERAMVCAWMAQSQTRPDHWPVHEDNWELVRFDEPFILDAVDPAYGFVPSVPDSPSDTWPEEKRRVYDFVMANVSPDNRPLVRLIHPEDLAKEKRRMR